MPAADENVGAGYAARKLEEVAPVHIDRQWANAPVPQIETMEAAPENDAPPPPAAQCLSDADAAAISAAGTPSAASSAGVAGEDSEYLSNRPEGSQVFDSRSQRDNFIPPSAMGESRSKMPSQEWMPNIESKVKTSNEKVTL